MSGCVDVLSWWVCVTATLIGLVITGRLPVSPPLGARVQVVGLLLGGGAAVVQGLLCLSLWKTTMLRGQVVLVGVLVSTIICVVLVSLFYSFWSRILRQVRVWAAVGPVPTLAPGAELTHAVRPGCRCLRRLHPAARSSSVF